jgi:threonine dehydrogenase-like Zn-dependent dehydrogenase
VAQVLAVGKNVKDYQVNDIIFNTSNHQSYFKIDTRYNFEARRSLYLLKVPEGLDPLTAVFARMVDVAMSGVRMADLSLGDTVLVIGQGLVGNFAAQLFQLAGADVMATDLVDFRLERARQCGINRTVNPGKQDLKQAVMDWTGGKGAQIVIEAIGFSPTIAQAVQLVRPFGEVILLGSPRGETVMDVTPMLSAIHGKHITMKGAFEWLWSVPESPLYYPSRHSKMGNDRQILGWLQSGAIKTKPLLTHLLPPEKCQEAYDGLAGGIKGTLKTEYLGVVFDWR